jgi:hypothetical protein
VSEDKKKIPADLLKLVQRPQVKDGRAVTKQESGEAVPALRAIKAAEVFDWSESETEVVVITVDGQRYRGAKPAAAA